MYWRLVIEIVVVLCYDDTPPRVVICCLTACFLTRLLSFCLLHVFVFYFINFISLSIFQTTCVNTYMYIIIEQLESMNGHLYTVFLCLYAAAYTTYKCECRTPVYR